MLDPAGFELYTHDQNFSNVSFHSALKLSKPLNMFKNIGYNVLIMIFLYDMCSCMTNDISIKNQEMMTRKK